MMLYALFSREITLHNKKGERKGSHTQYLIENKITSKQPWSPYSVLGAKCFAPTLQHGTYFHSHMRVRLKLRISSLCKTRPLDLSDSPFRRSQLPEPGPERDIATRKGLGFLTSSSLVQMILSLALVPEACWKEAPKQLGSYMGVAVTLTEAFR